MSWSSFAEIENQVLRLRLKDNKAVALSVCDALKRTRMNKDTRSQLIAELQVIIRGGAK